ncbi:DUF302 domain-containing protein [Salinigranum salinum]|uniref:DUF302 domain-containing protein n=1 Tax=Salinigranum salinum TaxID=1364937 RepID=UPI00126132C3|nr:DUF302 domain-containing protein [Salinigranum salinum]
MTLPIDPAVLTGDDIGEHRATLHMEHEEAIDHVRDAFKRAGFGTAVEFSLSDLLNEKIGADRDPYYVLGACNPEVADRALDATGNKLGGLVPCNVVVWQTEPGVQEVYHVSIMRIARLVGMAPDDEEMADIVATTGELVEEAWANLDTAAEAAADD